ncbi:tail completion [Citromicrobium phage vB_CbaS-RXM]|nr:tail completion [Citromicrobium phage vB_CbaS-RXM]
MSEESQRKLLVTRVVAKAKVFDPDLKIKLPNLPFDPPTNQVYGKMFILGGRSFNAANAGEKKLVRRTGILQITILSPEEKGTSKGNKAVDMFAKAFENWKGRDDEGIQYTFKTADVRYPTEAMSGWYPHIVRIPYYRDDYTDLPD